MASPSSAHETTSLLRPHCDQGTTGQSSTSSSNDNVQSIQSCSCECECESECECKHSQSLSQTRVRLQIAATMVCFMTLGLYTSSIGVLVPHLQRQFSLDEVQVAFAFLIPPVGYMVAAQLNHGIHVRFGQRGIAVLGPLCHVLCASLVVINPSFASLLAGLTAASFAGGLLDSSWCSWAATMDHANTVSGLLQGSFSIGAAAAPYLVAHMLSVRGSEWYQWFYVLGGVSCFELVFLAATFWSQDAMRYNSLLGQRSAAEVQLSATQGRKRMLSRRACWICAIYLLIYNGAETTVSDWVVTFMLRARRASPRLSGLTSSVFWAAMAAGRLMLGPVTDRVGLKRANAAYLAGAMVLVLALALVTSPALSAAVVAVLGFFTGPLYVSSLVRLNSKLPPEMHVAAVSFVASLGQVGSAVLPFALGALIRSFGIHVFASVLLVQFTAASAIWYMY